ncbi:isopeptide-forming domain-containing fimbrial protein [Lactobacillus curvatus]|nr:isopeptide-forming domain-containing fimbrial protein [Latilactobacillus curvatus]MSE24206.1 isopeptide-forming domain-containing fimbrial protein [Latilactobacillus curvatus]
MSYEPPLIVRFFSEGGTLMRNRTFILLAVIFLFVGWKEQDVKAVRKTETVSSALVSSVNTSSNSKNKESKNNYSEENNSKSVLINEKKLQASSFPIYPNMLKDDPNVNQVSLPDIGSKDTIPKEYAFYPEPTLSSQGWVVKDGTAYDVSDYIFSSVIGPTYSLFKKDIKGGDKNPYLYITNVGMYNGKIIDMKETFTDISETASSGWDGIPMNYGGYYSHIGSIRSTSYRGTDYKPVSFNWKFYVRDPKNATPWDLKGAQPIAIKGFVTFTAVMNNVFLSENFESIQGFYVGNTSEIPGKIENNTVYGGSKLPINSGAGNPLEKKYWITSVFNTKTINFVGSVGEGLFVPGQSTIKEIHTPNPWKLGDNISTKTNIDDDLLEYKINSYLPYRDKDVGGYLSQYNIEDTIDDHLKLKSYSIVDDSGNDVTSKFDCKVENQGSNGEGGKLTATPKNLNDTSLYAHLYTMSVSANIISIKGMQPIDKEGHFEFFDTATVNASDSSTPLPSNKASAVGKPLAGINISKQVKNLTDTTNQHDQFKENNVAHQNDVVEYKIDVQAIKEKLTTAKFSDSLNSNLEYQDGSLKVIDLDGSDEVKKNSSLEKEFKTNHAFAFNDLDVDYSKVATIEFDAKVKKGVADGTKIDNTATVSGKAAGNSISQKSNKSTLTIEKPLNGKVILKYIDRKTNQEIGDKEITVTGPIGKKVSELTTAEVSGQQDPNKIRPAFIKDYVPVDYTDNPDLTQATFYQVKDIDPIITDQPQTYTIRYERSALTFSAFKKLNFGDYLAHDSDATYYAKSIKNNSGKGVPYAVTISDYYGVKNWQLSVQQDNQFSGQYTDKDGNTKKVELENAEIQFENAAVEQLSTDGESTTQDKVDSLPNFKLKPGDSPIKVIDYTKTGKFPTATSDNTQNQTYDNPGFSTWSYHFGEAGGAETSDYSIGLHVPMTTKRYKADYTAKLTWTLTVAP